MLLQWKNANVFAILLAIAASATAQPVLDDPDRFQIELFAELEQFESKPKAIMMRILPETSDYKAGLYFTSGFLPSGHPGKSGVFYIDLTGELHTITDALDAFALLPLSADFGGGLLASDVDDGRLVRILPDDSIETFSEGVPLFDLAYGPDGNLYGTGFSDGTIYRIDENGVRQPFAAIPLPEHDNVAFGGVEGIAFDVWDRYGGGFLVSTFTMPKLDSPALNLDRIYTVSLDGQTVTPLTHDGMQAITFLTFGPGGAFGRDLYAAVYGTDEGFDGGVYTISPQGEMTRFLGGIDVEHVAFDSGGVFGGGMFVSDYNGHGLGPNAGRIWRITPTSSARSWDAMN